MAHIEPEIDELWKRSHAVVNMPSPELRDWLLSEPVWDDTYAPEPGIDIPALGERVLRLKEKRRTDLTEADIELMREVSDLIDGRLANPPPDGVRDEPWRHTLMTLGHDPLRTGEP
jgi:hypothetical protein